MKNNTLVYSKMNNYGRHRMAENKENFVVSQNHFFQHSGSTEYLSIVYFLEIARQCYMQIAHEILKVPLGIPMNLVILDFSLEAPISREGTLRVTATKENLPKTSSLNNIIKLSLFSSNKRIGSVKIIAQVLKK